MLPANENIGEPVNENANGAANNATNRKPIRENSGKGYYTSP